MTETGDRKPLTAEFNLEYILQNTEKSDLIKIATAANEQLKAHLATIEALSIQVATLTDDLARTQKSADDWQQMEEDQHTRADKAESALATVTAERDQERLDREHNITIWKDSLAIAEARATSAEQALAGVKERMTREKLIEVLGHAYAERLGWPLNEGIAFQADAISALMEGK